MIGKVSPRGMRVAGLIYYLFGPGRSAEHTDPHIVAGWRHPAELEPAIRGDGRRDYRRPTGLLQQPHAALGPRGFDRPVWHCSARAAPADRMLSDDQWAQVAGEVMHRTGLAPYGQDDDAVRWIAVRHADDHIHIVAMLARQDGCRPALWNDYFRVGEACRNAEERFGLRRTAPRDRTAARRPTRAESEKARRRGHTEAPRVILRRAVSTAAAAATSEPGFFARLEQAGILARKRYSTHDPRQVTGYAVALPGDTTRASEPVWFGGGKLAADLTLPKLRCRWNPDRVKPGQQFTPDERNAIWDDAASTAADAAREIRRHAATDPAAASDAAWAAADMLRASASMLGGRALLQAADSFDRAARAPYGRIPRPVPTGNSLRHAARLISAAAHVTDGQAAALVVFITHLAALADAVAEMRTAQWHAEQAAGARQAAARLYAARGTYRVRARRRRRPRTAAELAAADFLMPPGWPASGPLVPGATHSPVHVRPRPRGPGPPSPHGLAR